MDAGGRGCPVRALRSKAFQSFAYSCIFSSSSFFLLVSIFNEYKSNLCISDHAVKSLLFHFRWMALQTSNNGPWALIKLVESYFCSNLFANPQFFDENFPPNLLFMGKVRVLIAACDQLERFQRTALTLRVLNSKSSRKRVLFLFWGFWDAYNLLIQMFSFFAK